MSYFRCRAPIARPFSHQMYPRTDKCHSSPSGYRRHRMASFWIVIHHVSIIRCGDSSSDCQIFQLFTKSGAGDATARPAVSLAPHSADSTHSLSRTIHNSSRSLEIACELVSGSRLPLLLSAWQPMPNGQPRAPTFLPSTAEHQPGLLFCLPSCMANNLAARTFNLPGRLRSTRMRRRFRTFCTSFPATAIAIEHSATRACAAALKACMAPNAGHAQKRASTLTE